MAQGLAGGVSKEELWLGPGPLPSAYAALQGSQQQGLALLPGGKAAGVARGPAVQHGPELHATCAVIKLLQAPGEDKWAQYGGVL